jgi:hypothetical protein
MSGLAEIIARVAIMLMEPGGEVFSGEDHHRLLYDGDDA